MRKVGLVDRVSLAHGFDKKDQGVFAIRGLEIWLERDQLTT